MCPSPTAIPYADFERVEGWLTSNGAIHGTVLEYGCRVGYRQDQSANTDTGQIVWLGRLFLHLVHLLSQICQFNTNLTKEDNTTN